MQPTSPPSAETGVALKGILHGGQQPIAGAHVFVLAANTTGYPTSSTNGSVSLLTAGSGQNSASASVLPNAYYVTTDSNGSFSITSDYSCTAGQQVYLYASGGYSDGNPSDVNSAIGLMSVLGNCPSTGTSPFAGTISYVWVDEVTTVAAAYALAGYAYDAVHVSSSGTPLALTGIKNAFANAADLANIQTGLALTKIPGNSNATVPQTQIDTEANILAACVNTTSAASTACTTLFANALSGGATGTAPTDTATAMINMAHHPYVSSTVMTNLFSLPASTAAPFEPSLSTAPTDWIMPIVITGNGLGSPQSIAIDALGNAWVTSSDYNEVSVFTSSGAAATTPASPLSGNGLSDPQGIAIDALGNAWVTTYSGGVSVFTSSGAAATTPASPLSVNGSPQGIAFDASGNAWVTNYYKNEVNVFTSSGAVATTPASPLSGNGLNDPYGIAIDALGNIWVADSGASAVSVFTSSGAAATTPTSPLSGNGLAGPQWIAIDATGNAWVASPDTSNSSSVSEFTSSGSAVTGSPFGVSGVAAGVAIDGAGNVWCADDFTHNLGELNSLGTVLSPANGYHGSGSSPYSVAVDGAGDVWLVNSGANSVTLYIGAASPVVTPIVANLKSPYGSHAVNLP